MIFQIPQSEHAKVNESLQQLKSQHDQMYSLFKRFYPIGKKGKALKTGISRSSHSWIYF